MREVGQAGAVRVLCAVSWKECFTISTQGLHLSLSALSYYRPVIRAARARADNLKLWATYQKPNEGQLRACLCHLIFCCVGWCSWSYGSDPSGRPHPGWTGSDQPPPADLGLRSKTAYEKTLAQGSRSTWTWMAGRQLRTKIKTKS